MKAPDEFHRDGRARDGRRARCKVCSIEYQKAFYRENVDHYKAAYQVWRVDNRDAERARRKETYRKNREKALADARRWALENPERVRAAGRRYSLSPKGTIAQRKARYRLTTPEAREWNLILMADPCSYCGEPARCIDHIDPQFHGGGNEWWNLTAACRPCNSSKGTRSLVVWLARKSSWSPS